MKIKLIILMLVASTFSVFAEATNEVKSVNEAEKKSGDDFSKRKNGRKERTQEERIQNKKRNYEFMDTFLTELGIEEIQRVQIHGLQEEHRERMIENNKKSGVARKKLTELQDAGASAEEIDAAIEAVVETQAQQLRILVKNRMEMEEIMGAEKYKKFMERARQQFRRHQGRGKEGIPAKPKREREEAK